ncbi:NB-ARC domain-containing protein [Micromonospora sp. NBC_01699]|uniref:NB-ARC domain-containing protein n=1 Tax=Micromonospora sp. NBC_01699 TaxID=2975984 RepID=UPI002E30B4C1|nr:NB-ARC domain-containing protein [Micromonospora sp. NBC_01699]
MAHEEPLALFAARLRELRAECGEPSLRELSAYMKEGGRTFPRSTVGDKLAGVSKPSWEFVEAYVSTCARLGGWPADLEHWRVSYRRLLRQLAERRSGHRQAVAAQVELAGADPAARAEPGLVPAADPPRQLPGDVPAFTGREAEFVALDDLLTTSAAAGSVAVVSGTAGVGKTALAVHWAHRVAAAFPDGQLYLDLRGYDAEAPVTPVRALEGFLHALDGARAQTWGGVDELAARFRSVVAGRRMLLVLDNAGSVDQVRPLLPGTASCFVLVTSRDRLTALAVRHGARRVELDRLSLAESLRLLGALVGPRIGTEPDSAAVLARRCAQLPLALRIAGDLAAARPTAPLADLADDLADERHRLDLLDAGGDERTDVRAVFSWSYRRLDAGAMRLFRLLALHPGDFDRYAAAALAGLDPAELHRPLETLLRTHLVQRVDGDRMELHDLLRAYAHELLGDDERRRVEVLVDYYRHTAVAALDVASPDDDRYDWLSRGGYSGALPPFPSAEVARRWLDAERSNLMAVTDYAHRHERWDETRELSAMLWRYLDLDPVPDGGHPLLSYAR